jgi:hypothetical protein
LQEISRALRTHEESIQGSRTSNFNTTAKIHEIDHQFTTNSATIKGTLVQMKHHIAVLEVECNILRNLVIKLCEGEHYGASNQVQ